MCIAVLDVRLYVGKFPNDDWVDVSLSPNFFHIKEHFKEDKAKFQFRKSLHRCIKFILILIFCIQFSVTMDFFL